MDIHNAHPHGVIGLQTVDTNVTHDRWPCVSHPPEMRCADAIAALSRKPYRALSPASSQVPARDFVPAAPR
jgi:hypothetical protein